MPEQHQSFGQRLRWLRETAGFSQETLAERAGLSTNAISALERGERKRPYPDTIRRISEALDLGSGQREALAASARLPTTSPAPVNTGAAAPIPDTLPVEPDALIGRAAELEVTRQLLMRPETRLLTLTGPGGIGKTRLATRLANAVKEAFPDGVAWVDLAPLAQGALVLPAIDRALGSRSSPGETTPESIASRIGPRNVLLVLDNAEHVRDAAPDIAILLGERSSLKILATSRAPLSIRGEQEYIVPPLALPRVGEQDSADPSIAAAAELFVRSARLRQPRFEMTPENAYAVAQICRRLDGVPLALELAASRIPLLGVHELLRRLEASLPLLTGGKRDAPSRHRTMESTIQWSYDLLQPSAQWLFGRLSIFSGGWTLDAAETVSSWAGSDSVDVLDGMTTLIEHSLVRPIDDAQGNIRYSMLNTFREFGRNRLREAGDEPAVVRAHLQWITALAQTAEPHLFGPAQDYWLDRLAAEVDNVRASLGSGSSGDEGDRLRLAAAFWRFWYMRGYFAEGRAWLQRLLAAPGDVDDDTIAKALNGAGILAQESGDFPAAEAAYERALALRRASGDVRGVAYTLSNLGLLADHRGEYERAISLHEESLALSREADHQPGIGNALNNLGLVYRDLSDSTRARELHEESLEVLRRIGDQRGTANALNNLGNIEWDLGNLEQSRSLHRESLEMRRRLDDRPGIAMSLKNLGAIARLEAHYDEAAGFFRDSLLIRKDLADVLGAIPTIGEVAVLASATGHHKDAARLVSAIRAIRSRLGAPAPLATQKGHVAIMCRAVERLGRADIEAEERAGASLDGDRVILDAIAFLDHIS